MVQYVRHDTPHTFFHVAAGNHSQVLGAVRAIEITRRTVSSTLMPAIVAKSLICKHITLTNMTLQIHAVSNGGDKFTQFSQI